MITKRSAKILIYALSTMLVVIVVILLLLWHPFHPPARPTTVPQTAKWEGGPDGGNWIDCVPSNDSTNQFFCIVYEDRKGEILYKGDFRLSGKHASLAELRELLGTYSGDYIYLNDGRKMVSIIPLDSSTYDEMMKRQPPKNN